MLLPPAVIVHGLNDARKAVAAGLPVTLLSAPGAAAYAGCGWWQALLRALRNECPQAAVADLLDCGEASGQALAALRIGLRHLVLAPQAPGWDAVAAIAAGQGGRVMRQPPPALDLGSSPTDLALRRWLGSPRNRTD
jgi:hypothetical protein